MTIETIEWYSPNEKSPECPPGSPLLVITQDDRCVTDQIWTPQGFAFPDRNTMQWMMADRTTIKLWAYLPKGNDNPIVIPGSFSPKMRNRMGGSLQ